ncbi:unnamed protein product [Haemonchus placei]|uniref:Acid-sensing ion channel 1-like n=1 Tax=Haemonchus placei TaxID=6290 RepID=A0A158QQT7_HAEPC|nr:unnamed protein product [Haemonchus placei]
MGLAQVLHDFANWSTVCGVPHIANARTRAWRIFWSVVFICMFSMFVYQLYTMIVKFISFPSNVNTEIFFKEQAFPVVTVCNSNPYKFSAILNQSNNLDTIKHLMDVYVGASSKSLTASDEYGLYARNEYPTPQLCQCYHLNRPSVKKFFSSFLKKLQNLFSKRLKKYCSHLFQELMNTDYEKEQRAWDALALEAAQLGEEMLNPALYTFGELITDCTFSGKKCSAADFTRIFDPIYGACYSFNEDSTLSYSTSRAGMKFGLKLLITVSQQTTSMVKDFLPTTKMAGARVAIHPRGVHAALDNNGINVGVGYQTAISLVSTRTQRLKEPYGKCVDTEPAATNLYKAMDCWYGVSGAAPPNIYRVILVSDSDGVLSVDCLTSLRGDQASTSPNISPLQDCSCGPPCSETSYLTTASISKFPAEDYFVATDPTQGVVSSWFWGEYSMDIFNSFQDPRRCREWYAKNALLLQVFFETLKYESYTEVPSYGISPALNDLGGQAGLWLGLSVISVIEDIGEVKKELDHADRHDKAMYEEDDDIDIEDEINDNNNEKKAE